MQEQNRMPKPGDFYKHFKDKLYQIIAVAIHSETREEMVVYQALYGDFQVYVRPLSMFASEVDHEKYPDVVQKYRFELVQRNGNNILDKNISEKEIEEPVSKSITPSSKVSPTHEKSQDSSQVESELLLFLDSYTCKDKLNVLLGMKNHITDTVLNSMLISMDLAVSEGTLEERFEILKDYLQARIRFESNRLR